ncbi:MAG: MBOAT family protein [Clostridia bacterium]|nr:MBOAT family protein [Clostridia bacterium]
MSLTILIVFAIALSIVYYLCPGRFRQVLLLLASLAYYAYCGIRAVPFLLITAMSTWLGARVIAGIGQQHKDYLKEHKAEMTPEQKKAAKRNSRGRQRIVFIAVLLLNFGMLALFKYTNNFLEMLSSVTRQPFRPLNLLLPLGISFYTFQSTGYLMDIYNGKYAPEQNPLRYLLFVSFFPQLIQGPIARFDQLGKQFSEDHPFDLDQYERALLLMLWGFFKKRVIADRALLLVDGVFSNSGAYGGAVIAIAVLFYSLQQYCDFSGGIDIAIGIGELFGIRLPPNFRRPYLSVSLTDFWHRWHISLGNWMRDYVFYPFALSRPVSALSKALKARHPQLSRTLPAALGNILIFLLVGIWHGLQMNYILWGLYNGCILAFTALADPFYKKWNEQNRALAASKGFYLFRVLRTFLVVNIGWFFDRAETASEAVQMLVKTFTQFNWAQISAGVLLEFDLKVHDYNILIFSTLLLLVISILGERGKDVRKLIFTRPLLLRWLILMTFMYLTLAFFMTTGGGSADFLYAVF